MTIELRVPEVGESIAEVTIGDWLKQVGDLIDRDEPVVVIETDKVTCTMWFGLRYMSNLSRYQGNEQRRASSKEN